MGYVPGTLDPYFMAKVLSDILSRERGYPIKIILTPKDPKDVEKSG